jgi:uncharacterized protein
MTKQLLEYIIKSIVSDAQVVEVTEVLDNNNVTFKIKVGQEDRGRLIGREGRTIRSLRAIVQSVAENVNRHCTVELVD